MFRGALAVVVGYAVFAISAVLLFELSGVDPHALGFRAFATVYGAGFALGCGALVAVMAGSSRPLAYVGALAAIIAVSGAASLLARPGDGAIWSQLSALLLFAPLALAGGVIAARRRRGALS